MNASNIFRELANDEAARRSTNPGVMALELEETPVFDRRDTPCVLSATEIEWQPPRRITVRGASINKIACQGDPEPLPSEDDATGIDRFIQRGSAWYSSCRFSGHASNDNKDWPLEKLLLTEKNETCMALARRYRALYETATVIVTAPSRSSPASLAIHPSGSSRLLLKPGKTFENQCRG